jgi:hypothetical protein
VQRPTELRFLTVQNLVHALDAGKFQNGKRRIPMKKVALFAFIGEPMCFAHVLLNAFEMKEKGYDVRIVMEGSATKLVKDFHEDETLPFAKQYKKAVEQGLVDAVCDACAAKMGSKQSAVDQGLKLVGEMKGHPSVSRYLEEGFEVLTF